MDKRLGFIGEKEGSLNIRSESISCQPYFPANNTTQYRLMPLYIAVAHTFLDLSADSG